MKFIDNNQIYDTSKSTLVWTESYVKKEITIVEKKKKVYVVNTKREYYVTENGKWFYILDGNKFGTFNTDSVKANLREFQDTYIKYFKAEEA